MKITMKLYEKHTDADGVTTTRFGLPDSTLKILGPAIGFLVLIGFLVCMALAVHAAYQYDQTHSDTAFQHFVIYAIVALWLK